MLVAERALQACGYQPTHIVTGGASDANSLEAAGFPCTNLADGTENNHQPTERISLSALEGMFEVAIALIDGAAAEFAEEAATERENGGAPVALQDSDRP